MVRIYRTRVPGASWYDPDRQAALLEQLDLQDRRLIGFDESLADEGIVLLISMDKESSSARASERFALDA
jgi:hypothetical protein